MEFSREEQPAIIKIFCAKGENCVNLHRELVSVCGDSAMDYSNENRWMEKFKKGRVSGTDLPRPGRPSSSRTAAKKERVENLILSDCWVTVEDICAHTGLTHGTVMRIIKEDLQMTKVSARWVPKMLDESKKEIRMTCSEEMLTRHQSDPHFLEKLVTMDETWILLFNPETKSQSKQWKHSESPPPKKFRVGASAEKILYSMFWDQKGVILSYPIPKGMTITGECYRDILKNQLLPAVAEKRPELVGNFILHQDNAPPHKARIVTEFLVEQGIETLRHPPYSPDLVPSDFWLFDTLKLSLQGRQFPSRSAVYQSLKHIPKDSIKNAMKRGLGIGNCV
jgi:histone-lysine N-methyltransferase SETMAR